LLVKVPLEAFHHQLMSAANKLELVCLVELIDNITAKQEASSTR
jgi:hypothetical protein